MFNESSQIFLKCLNLARIGRPDILWSVNKLARGVTKWTRACDKRLARLLSYIHHTSDQRQYCRVGNTAQHCQIFLDTLKTPNQLRGGRGRESCAFSEVEHVPPSVGCARSNHQCFTVPQHRELFRWMLAFAWTVSPLSVSRIWL